jgi:hypothetical protein
MTSYNIYPKRHISTNPYVIGRWKDLRKNETLIYQASALTRCGTNIHRFTNKMGDVFQYTEEFWMKLIKRGDLMKVESPKHRVQEHAHQFA